MWMSVFACVCVCMREYTCICAKYVLALGSRFKWLMKCSFMISSKGFLRMPIHSILQCCMHAHKRAFTWNSMFWYFSPPSTPLSPWHFFSNNFLVCTSDGERLMTTITANKLINMQNCVYYRMNFEISFQLDISTRMWNTNSQYHRGRTDAPAQTQRHTIIWRWKTGMACVRGKEKRNNVERRERETDKERSSLTCTQRNKEKEKERAYCGAWIFYLQSPCRCSQSINTLMPLVVFPLSLARALSLAVLTHICVCILHRSVVVRYCY